MKKFKKILIWTIVTAIYLNIGWALGTFMHYDVQLGDPSKMSGVARIFSGGWSALTPNDKDKVNPLLTQQIILSIFWPFMIVLVMMTWIIYWLISAIVFLFHIIFAGGLAELIGTCWMIIISFIAAGSFVFVELIRDLRKKRKTT